MENNSENVVNPTEPLAPPQSYPSPQKDNSTKKVLLLLGFLAAVALLGVGYIFYSKTPKVYNATVYSQPTTSVITPAPSVYQSNPKDTSNQALNQDTQASSQDLNNLDSSLNSVDQGLSDQQTNLQ
jgi:hypothetical protein